MAEKLNLVVIGAGPGGYEAALYAAEQGMSTALIEKEALGGTCLNHGCIPTKTLMHASDLYREMGKCAELGLSVGDIAYDMGKIQDHKNEVTSTLRTGIAGMMKRQKVAVYEGIGTITGEHTVEVKDAQGTVVETLEAEHILIATGSSTFVPPIKGTDLPNVITSDELLEKRDLYQHLIVIGGGVIGMEFASVYSALGAEVTVIEALDRILSTMDKEIAQNLKMIMKKRNVDIHAGARVEEIKANEDGSLTCCYLEKDQMQEVTGDGILVAVGRRAYTNGLFAENVSIEMDRGRILANAFHQTSIPSIYAIGDVIGGVMLAHVATAEGKNAVDHMQGQAPTIREDVIPGCVYTDPEIATVGISGEEAKQSEIEVVTKKYVMGGNAKSVLSGQERGFIKVVADAKTEKIIGAQMMCARATDMIGEFATAIGNELTLQDMVKIIRPHPTFGEGITEACRL